MTPFANHQEILLFTGSSFAHRQWAEKEIQEDARLSEREKLEIACWNGLIRDALPEIDSEYILGKKLWLWEIRETRSFLELELSDFPSTQDKWASLDPYAFLETNPAN